MFLARLCGALALLALGFAGPAWANPADILLVNGKIVTLDGTSQVSEALAIEAGRVAATGSTDAMRKLFPSPYRVRNWIEFNQSAAAGFALLKRVYALVLVMLIGVAAFTNRGS